VQGQQSPSTFINKWRFQFLTKAFAAKSYSKYWKKIKIGCN